MGKGSVRRPKQISDEELEKAWNSIFAGHPNEDDFKVAKEDIKKRKREVEQEDGYGNIMTPPEKPKPRDPDKYVDELGDS